MNFLIFVKPGICSFERWLSRFRLKPLLKLPNACKCGRGGCGMFSLGRVVTATFWQEKGWLLDIYLSFSGIFD